jgi:glutathione S-transferase
MANPLPVLYSFRRCPYAMRARLALLVSGQSCELREVVLSQKPPAMLAVSPKGTVPVLVLPNNEVIEQSLEIMIWALQQADPLDWLPASEEHTARVTHLIARCDGPFKSDLDRYKWITTPGTRCNLLERARSPAKGNCVPERRALWAGRRRHCTFCAAICAY